MVESNLCLKDEWVSGLWWLMIGNVMLVSGLLSVCVVHPLLAKD
tara:strand:+ start:894 stop:1025 length:132 start_codon:yes stop_codon:yes gene_type:complete